MADRSTEFLIEELALYGKVDIARILERLLGRIETLERQVSRLADRLSYLEPYDDGE